MPPSRSYGSTRACDACRRRKVKCGSGEHASELCANCRISRLPCQYTSVPKQRGPKVPQDRAHAQQQRPVVQSVDIQESPGHESVSDEPLWQSPPASAQHHSPEAQLSLPGTSPLQTTSAVTFCGLDLVESTTSSAQGIRDSLLKLIGAAQPSLVPVDAVNACIDLFMQYTFPSSPTVHETTLRATATRFFSNPHATDLFCSSSHQAHLEDIRAFTLVTALCASVASVMPESLLPCREVMASPCLNVSRQMLQSFEDIDVEHPNSTSIVIRILHATALEHLTGKTTLSYHILGQANLLIRSMRLYSEEALEAYDPLEAQLLRNVYWQMYAADKSSMCLQSRPPLLHELLFDEHPTLHSCLEHFVPLFDPGRLGREAEFEQRLLVGFQLLPRLWSSAASLLSDMRAYTPGTQNSGHRNLTQAYMKFLEIMDDLPDWLFASNIMASYEDTRAVQFQKTSFWVQRCTLLVSFHCLRLVILQESIDSKVWDIMGLNNHPSTLPIAKIEMVNDFIETLDNIPFIYIQIKGESTVERIRRVGSFLLEMIANVADEPIKTRAELCFSRILNLLAKLNPKSTDVLVDLTNSRPRTARSRQVVLPSLLGVPNWIG